MATRCGLAGVAAEAVPTRCCRERAEVLSRAPHTDTPNRPVGHISSDRIRKRATRRAGISGAGSSRSSVRTTVSDHARPRVGPSITQNSGPGRNAVRVEVQSSNTDQARGSIHRPVMRERRARERPWFRRAVSTRAGAKPVRSPKAEAMSAQQLLDAAGRPRSPATMPVIMLAGSPRTRLAGKPTDPPTVDEIVAVMRQPGDDRHGRRVRGLIAALCRPR
jgi:hypothetical protein